MAGIIEFGELAMKEEISSNDQTTVYRAIFRKRQEVAVKVFTKTSNELYDSSIKEEAAREAALMQTLPPHPNVIGFVGLLLEPLGIVTQLAEEGSAADLLRRMHSGPGLSWTQLLRVALDIAIALRHLHQYTVLHRDIALRNVVVGADWKCRVCDFGMARMIFHHGQYLPTKEEEQRMPLLWLAPELLEHAAAAVPMRYTREADVWAFGITMWEIVTPGQSDPYPELSNAEVVSQVRLGGRPSLLGCPTVIRDIIQR